VEPIFVELVTILVRASERTAADVAKRKIAKHAKSSDAI
jgi:hypothetical protein